jgi:hypothetical protein
VSAPADRAAKASASSKPTALRRQIMQRSIDAAASRRWTE